MAPPSPMLRASAAIGAVFLAIYLPDLGHGFISDDFRWIVESRLAQPSDLVTLFATNVGFYRPLVKLAFAADYAIWDVRAIGYGLTNLILCLATAAALFTLVRRFGLSGGSALTAAAVWLLNFHAVNMAVLWLSGRTSLLVSLLSLLTAHAWLKGRTLLAGLCALLAMLAKEEAIVLPGLFGAAAWLQARRWQATSRSWPLWTAAAIYLALRLLSGAFWPADAPAYYRFSFSPALVARNAVEYADRAGTVFAAVVVVLMAWTRLRPSSLTGEERRVLVFAALWVVATYALTVFLPVRSSLYALLPSLGSALALAAFASAAARVHPHRFQQATLALIVVAALLIPVYRSRNVRWVAVAELSETAIATMRADTANRPAGHIVLIDAPGERFNLQSAFGGLLPDALRLHIGAGWTGELVGPADRPVRRGDLTYRLENGLLLRE